MTFRIKLLLVIFGVFCGFVAMEVILFCCSFPLASFCKNCPIERGQEHSVQVLCLGDSFTYGIGAGSNQSYPEQLKQILKTKIQRDIIVINGGMPSANSTIILEKLKSFLKYVKPDIIIITAGRNDIWNYKHLNQSLNWKVRLNAFFSQSRVYNLFSIIQINLENVFNEIKLKQFGGEKNNYALRKNFDAKILAKANALRDAKLFDQAMVIYKQLIKKYPDNAEILLEMGRCYKLNGQDAKAVAILKIALLADAKNPDILKELEAVLLKNKALKYKMEFFNKLFILLPENEEIKRQVINADIQLADSYYQQGDNDKALVYYNKAIALEPYNEKIYNRVFYNIAMESEHNQPGFVDNHQKGIGQIVWQITYDNIVKIAEICKQKGIKLILSGYPEEIYDPVNTAAKDYNIIFVDQRKDFADKQAMGQRNKYLIQDGHCTQLGYRIMAENISAVIVNLLK
jgi:lysophospholipase L1-like esterase